MSETFTSYDQYLRRYFPRRYQKLLRERREREAQDPWRRIVDQKDRA